MVTRRQLAQTFFLIGLTSFGGPAIVAQIREVVVRRKRWITDAEFEDTVAFCQLVPGPVAVQTAAHIGWRLHGGVGAAIALVTYVVPAFLLMVGLSFAYFHFGGVPVVAAVLKGMRAATVGIVVGSIVALGATALRDWRGVAVALVATSAFLLRLNVVLVLLGAGLLGVVLLWRQSFARAAAPAPARPVPARPLAPTLVGAGVLLALFGAGVALSGRLSPLYPALGAAMIKVNLLAFGGGYTAVALMYQQVVVAHAWLTPGQFVDGLALSQVTPGPVIVTATFIGYHQGGPLAAVYATVCVFLPSSLLLVLAAPQFERLRQSGVVASLVRGLLAAFMAMLFYVLWQVARAAIVDPFTLLLTLAAIAALRLRTNPAWIVVGAVVVALLFGR